MKKKSEILKGVFILTSSIWLLTSLTTTAQTPIEKHETLAKKLVNQCANIHENDFVLISGSVRDSDLMDEIAIQVRKVGAFPLVTLSSEQRNRRYYDVVPAKYDTQTPDLDVQLANIITATITIDAGETLDLFEDVPPERMAAVSETYTVFSEIYDERNIRGVNLGNGLYPTNDLAKQFDMTKEDLSKQFWNGVNTDYEKLEKIGESIKSKLTGGKKIQITSQSGTDLSFEITDRPVMVSDGVISDEEKKMGSPACYVWLPAGEVYLAPVPGTAEGKVILDRHFYQGKEIKKLTLKFEAGKLVSMSAESGLEPYKARYDAAGKGKDEFSLVDIGINPSVEIIPASKMVAWMVSGMISVGHGNNSWLGGENNSAYGSAYYLSEATLKVDGKVIVDKGVLKN